jgi:hypothetical protein
VTARNSRALGSRHDRARTAAWSGERSPLCGRAGERSRAQSGRVGRLWSVRPFRRGRCWGCGGGKEASRWTGQAASQ